MPRAWTVASIALFVGLGCSDPTPPAACPELPDPSACPIARGGSCDDKDCTAIYDCVSGAWSLVQRCDHPPPADAGPDGDATDEQPVCSADTLIGPPESAACGALQAPECDARIVDSCPAQACTTGCEVFLRCNPDGWSAAYAAYCDDDGQLVVNPLAFALDCRDRAMRLVPVILATVSLPSGCTFGNLDRLSSEYGSTAPSSAGGSGAATGGTGGSGGAAGYAGGGGSAGMSGRGGAAGTSGAAGAKPCDAAGMSCILCAQCVQQPGGACESAAMACEVSPPCNSLADCYAQCQGSSASCFMNCVSAYPMGVEPYNTVETCIGSACSMACGTHALCQGFSPSASGSCFAGMGCNPVTSQGCNASAGEVCDFDGSTFSCFTAAQGGPYTAMACSSCDTAGCVAGTSCVPADASLTHGICAKFCCTNDDCGTKGICGHIPAVPIPAGGFCLMK